MGDSKSRPYGTKVKVLNIGQSNVSGAEIHGVGFAVRAKIIRWTCFGHVLDTFCEYFLTDVVFSLCFRISLKCWFSPAEKVSDIQKSPKTRNPRKIEIHRERMYICECFLFVFWFFIKKICFELFCHFLLNVPRHLFFRDAETPRRRGAETPRCRAAERPKRRDAETSKRRDAETPKRRDAETQDAETPRRRDTETPKRRDAERPNELVLLESVRE